MNVEVILLTVVLSVFVSWLIHSIAGKQIIDFIKRSLHIKQRSKQGATAEKSFSKYVSGSEEDVSDRTITPFSVFADSSSVDIMKTNSDAFFVAPDPRMSLTSCFMEYPEIKKKRSHQTIQKPSETESKAEEKKVKVVYKPNVYTHRTEDVQIIPSPHTDDTA